MSLLMVTPECLTQLVCFFFRIGDSRVYWCQGSLRVTHTFPPDVDPPPPEGLWPNVIR
jgi:hypothetical protein